MNTKSIKQNLLSCYTIYSWMVLPEYEGGLNLHGSELFIYALIYEHSHAIGETYCGTLQDIADATGVCRIHVSKCLKALQENNLIKRYETKVCGTIYYSYKALRKDVITTQDNNNVYDENLTTAIQLLQSYNYIPFCTNLCKLFNTKTIILLAELCKQYTQNNNSAFKISQPNLCANTGLTVYEIQSSLKILEKYDVISHTRVGLPATNYYNVHIEQLQNILKSTI